MREKGLVKKEVWVRPEHAGLLSNCERQLREKEPGLVGLVSNTKGVISMDNATDAWTTQSLVDALSQSVICKAEQAQVELVDGVEPSILVTMREFGDLPIYMTVSGNQIIVEALLWSVEDVKDVEAFNDAVLRTHKYFPLSTISLDHVGDTSYYHMFGALSATSKLENVVLEIETLASNVIQATEAYGEFLSLSVAAS